MSDKALPALEADADKEVSESVKFWFRLACAAAKRNLRDSYPKASTEKQTVSLLGEGHPLGLGDCEQCCTYFGRCGAVLWCRARGDGVGVMAAMKSESLDAWWPWRRRAGASCFNQWIGPIKWIAF